MTKKAQKSDDLQAQLAELTADLQRQRADFENYRKRVEAEKSQLTELTAAATIMKLLPIIDTLERAIDHAPDDLAQNAWAQGVVAINKTVQKMLGDLQVERIPAAPGMPFDPDVHEAITMHDGPGEQEVVAQELRAGYRRAGRVIRPSMVNVERR